MDIQIFVHRSSMRTFPYSFNCSKLCLLFVACSCYIHSISHFKDRSSIDWYRFIFRFLLLKSLGSSSIHHSKLHSYDLDLLYLHLFDSLFLCFRCYYFFHQFNSFRSFYFDFNLIFIVVKLYLLQFCLNYFVNFRLQCPFFYY